MLLKLIYTIIFTLLSYTAAADSEIIQKLIERRDLIKLRAPHCTGEHAGQMSLEYGKCSQGDMALWAGLSCLAAYYAEDHQTYQSKCQDVKNSQGSNGRWWRGPTKINNHPINSFSRDMMKGVVAYFLTKGHLDPNSNHEAIKSQAIKWVEYLDQNKKMCDEATDNRCHITIGSSALLYKTLEKIGVIEELERRNIKIIKKWKRRVKHPYRHIDILEYLLTPRGYQTHLKALGNMFSMIMSNNPNSRLSRNKIIYQKDPTNPFYSFLYQGTTNHDIKNVFEMCKVNRLLPEERSLDNSYYLAEERASWSLQRDMKQRMWEINQGHDCIFILNMFIADLKNRIPWSRKNISKAGCPSSEQIDTYHNRPVCFRNQKITHIECLSKHKAKKEIRGNSYCIESKKGFYIARQIEDNCPSGLDKSDDFKGYPVCERDNQKILLSKCKNNIANVYLEAEHACLVNKTHWFEKVPILDYCPSGKKYIALGSDKKPICASGLSFKIKRSKCLKKNRSIYLDQWCLKSKKGYYLARRIH